MDLESAVARLYGLPLDDFIAERTELAKAAKAEGDAESSAQFKALRKPTIAAWVVNQVSRHEPHRLDTLIELGEGLREASSALDGTRLRELSPRRRAVVEELVEHARRLTAEHDVRVSGEVADRLYETFDAAVVDAAAGAAVQAGRLTHALRHAGFGIVDETGEPADVISLGAARTKRERPAPTADKRRPARRADAHSAQAAAKTATEERRAQADADVTTAEARAQSLKEAHADASAEVDRATGRIQELTAELEGARRDLAKAKTDARKARSDAERAERSAESTRRRRREAHDRLSSLD